MRRTGTTATLYFVRAGSGDELAEGFAIAAPPPIDRFSSLGGRGGSALGLPIARAVARAHGGDLAYESGAFTMRLPAVPADRPPGR